MPDHEPVSAEPIAEATGSTPWWATGTTAWSMARGALEASTATYWLATVRPNGTPHVMPVLAVWVEGGLFFAAGARTRKARNLSSDPHCVVTVEEERLDLVVEGRAAKLRDAATLQRVADAYAEVYGWRVAVRDGAFHDTEGAPTAGPPPFDVYELAPTVAFGFPLDETIAPTRWRF